MTFDRRQPGRLQHSHMLRDGRQRHVEARRQFRDRSVATGEAVENLSAGGIPERGKRRIEVARIINHMV